MDEHNCYTHPEHRDGWMLTYLQLVVPITAARVAVVTAQARVQGQHGGYRKRLDRAISKRHAANGGQHHDGPMPLLGVKHKALDSAQAELDNALAFREAAYARVRAHRSSCVPCREALDKLLQACDACGLKREDVADDPESNGFTWQRCSECRDAGLQVSV
jgi:hypothetical protein